MLRDARRRAGLTLDELARRAGTSGATLSAYEHGRKTPITSVFERILDAAGFRLTVEPKITFHEVPAYRGRTVVVPDRLPHNPRMGKVTLPRRVFWSGRSDYDMTRRSDVEAVYAAVMTNGTEQDILDLIDGQTLLEVFDGMYLPPLTRAAWQPTIDAARAHV